MKIKLSNLKFLLVAIAISPVAAFGTGVGVDGNIYTSGGYIHAAVGQIVAGNYMAAGAYVQAGTYFYSPGYITVNGHGLFGDYLRVGGNSNTPASKSVQIGQYATNSSFNALVVGQYNVNKAKDGTTAPSSTTWVSNDPLFVVGNGTSTTPKNAFTVYKDGTVTMSQAQGDIGMGQFGN